MSSLPKSKGIPSALMRLSLRNEASPPAYELVANLGDFTGAGITWTIADTTAHGDDWETLVTTIKKAGEVSGPIFFDIDNASHLDATRGLWDICDAGDLRAWSINLIGSTGAVKYLIFHAYVSQFALKFPVKNVLSADFKLSIDGQIVLGDLPDNDF